MGKLKRLEKRQTETKSAAPLVITLTEQVGFFLFSYSPASKSLTSWSPNAQAVLGAPDSAIRRDANLFLRYVYPEDRFTLLAPLERALAGAEPYLVTYRWLRPDNNELRWLHCRAKLTSQTPEPLFEGVIIDVTKETDSVLARRESADAVNTVLAALPPLIFTVDRDLRIVRANRTNSDPGCKFGDPSFDAPGLRAGRSFLDCFSDTKHRSNFNVLLDDLVCNKSSRHCARFHQDEKIFNVEINQLVDRSLVEGLVFIVSDITESVRLENRLSALQRAEAVHLLASGVAHHFNNTLQGIVGQAALVQSHPENRELVLDAARMIIESTAKASDLSKQLFVIEEQNNPAPQEVDLNVLVLNSTEKLQDLLAGGLKIAVMFGNPPLVKASRSSLAKVMESLLRWTQSVLPQDQHGQSHASIRTFSATLNQFETANLPAGNYGCIEISQTASSAESEASGTPLSIFQKLPEPFFETEQASLRPYGGALSVQFSANQHLRMTVYLPSCEVHQTEAKQPAEKVLPHGNPSVLIVDDDSAVLESVSSLLRELGIGCLTADNQRSAMQLTRSFGKTIKLILLDAVMPGFNSSILLKRLRRAAPQVKVIGFTGGSGELTQSLLTAGAVQVLEKPLPPSKLLETIKNQLNL